MTSCLFWEKSFFSIYLFVYFIFVVPVKIATVFLKYYWINVCFEIGVIEWYSRIRNWPKWSDTVSIIFPKVTSPAITLLVILLIREWLLMVNLMGEVMWGNNITWVNYIKNSDFVLKSCSSIISLLLSLISSFVREIDISSFSLFILRSGLRL